MTNNKQPIVKMNGEKINKSSLSSTKLNAMEHCNEQAATVEKSAQSKHPLAIKKRTVMQSFFSKFIHYDSVYKKVGFAVIIAAIVGSILGFSMLHVFGSIDNGVTEPTNNTTVSLHEEEKDNPEKSKDTITLHEQKAYVLQGGVFEEKKNAEALLKKMQTDNVLAMIWHENGEYTVLAGVSPTINDAEKLAKEIKTKSQNTFIKEWKTNSSTVNLSTQEMDWLKTFEHVLSDSIATVENGSLNKSKEWKEVVENVPKKTNELASLIDTIKHSIDKENIQENATTFLLTIWYEYNQTITNLS